MGEELRWTSEPTEEDLPKRREVVSRVAKKFFGPRAKHCLITYVLWLEARLSDEYGDSIWPWTGEERTEGLLEAIDCVGGVGWVMGDE